MGNGDITCPKDVVSVFHARMPGGKGSGCRLENILVARNGYQAEKKPCIGPLRTNRFHSLVALFPFLTTQHFVLYCIVIGR